MENHAICLIPGTVEDMLKKRAQPPVYLQVLKLFEMSKNFYKLQISDSVSLYNAAAARTAVNKSMRNKELRIKSIIKVTDYNIIKSKNGDDIALILENFIVKDLFESVIGNPKLLSLEIPKNEVPPSILENNTIKTIDSNVKVIPRLRSDQRSIFYENYKIIECIDEASKTLNDMKIAYNYRLSNLEKQMQEMQISIQNLLANKIHD